MCSSIWPETVGAALGAVLAFVFYLLTNYLVRVHQGQRRYHRALVDAERLLHEYINVIYEIGGDIAGVRNSVSANRVQWTLPRGFLLRRSAIREIAHRGLVQELFELNTDIRRANADLDSLGSAYQLVRQRYLETGDVNQYRALADSIADGYEIVAGLLPDIQHRIQTALAKIQYLVVRDTPTARGWLRWRRKVSVIDEKLLQEQLKVVYDQTKPRIRPRRGLP